MSAGNRRAARDKWKAGLTSRRIKRRQAGVRPRQKVFSDHLAALQRVPVDAVETGFKKWGQTAFYVAYEDLQSVEVMKRFGPVIWGFDHQLDALDKSLKKQNPETRISAKGQQL